MPINSVNFYFKHFEKHRELPGVKKEPLLAVGRDSLIDSVEMNLRTNMSRDNQPEDLDPVEGQVLSVSPSGVSSASYSMDDHGKHLRVTSAEGERRYLCESHLCDRGLEMLSFTSLPGVGGTLLCFHSDLTQPENDFVQCLNLPWVGKATRLV